MSQFPHFLGRTTRVGSLQGATVIVAAADGRPKLARRSKGANEAALYVFDVSREPALRAPVDPDDVAAQLAVHSLLTRAGHACAPLSARLAAPVRPQRSAGR